MKTKSSLSGRSCRASLAAIFQQPGQQPIQRRRTTVVGVLRAAPGAARPDRSQRPAQGSATAWPRRHRAVPRNENFLAGNQKHLDTLPGVGQQAGAGAGRLENSRGGRKSCRRHAVAADVQHRQGADVQGVVVAGRHMPQLRHVGRTRLVVPAGAAEQKRRVAADAAARKKSRPALAVRQPVARERSDRPGSDLRPAPDGASADRARCRSARNEAPRARDRRRPPARRRHRSAPHPVPVRRGAARGPAPRRSPPASPGHPRPRRCATRRHGRARSCRSSSSSS